MEQGETIKVKSCISIFDGKLSYFSLLLVIDTYDRPQGREVCQ